MGHRAMGSSVCLVTALACLVLLQPMPRSAVAEDYFLAIGGGPQAASNEASLEANIRYLQRLLDDAGVADDRQHFLFADGGDTNYEDLQYLDAAAFEQAPELHRELAMLYDTYYELGYRYRPSAVPGVAGPANRAHIDAWFDEHAGELGAGDRLVVYFTGHGGSGSDDQPRRTDMALWNDRPLRVDEFAERLDRLDPEVDLVLVLVQCYSGGFADVIFEGADQEKALTKHRRVGFYAAPYDRVSTGCTPDVDEANYADYTSYFFSAAFGKDRLGNAVTDADIDGDGVISLIEAHAYVLLKADTIDIPTTMSDAFLRRYSEVPANPGHGELLAAESDFDRLRGRADAYQAAVLEGLSEQVGVSGPARIRDANRAMQRIRGERSRLERRRGQAQRAFNEARQELANALHRRYPQLRYTWQPELPRLLEERGDAILSFIEGHPAHERLWRAYGQLGELYEQIDRLRREAARFRRLVEMAETVALAANLENTADAEIVERYRELLTMERQPLVPGD